MKLFSEFRRRRGMSGDQGSMLLALLMTTVLIGLGAVMVATTLGESNSVRHDQRFTDVLPAADAGISRGLFMLNNGKASALPTAAPTPITIGNQTADWSASVQSSTTAPPSYLLSATTRGTQRTLKALAYQSSRFAFGAFADKSIVFRGGNGAASYNSNSGNRSATGHGALGSNGSVTLNGNATADSVTLFNWGSDPSASRCSGGPCSGGFNTVNAPFDITSSSATQFISNGLAACSSTPAVTSSALGNHALPSGTWCASSLNLDVDTTVTGPTVIYVSGNVTIGNHLNINYSASTEPMAPNLQIYMLGTSYDMGNHTTIAGAIYAPLAFCNGGAQSTVYGSLVCGQISNQGGWQFNYDDALATVGGGDFRIKNYREG